MLFVIMFIKIRLNYISMPGVWFRVLYGVLRKHNNVRVADNSPLYKDILCYYMDRAYN